MADLAGWYEFAERLHAVAVRMATAVRMPLKERTRIFGAALLARTISNFEGVLILPNAEKLVEARLVMRACLENLFSAALIAKEGEAVIDEMDRIDMAARKAEGEFLITRQIGESAADAQLRVFLKASSVHQINSIRRASRPAEPSWTPTSCTCKARVMQLIQLFPLSPAI